MRWHVSGQLIKKSQADRRAELIGLLAKNRGLETKAAKEAFFNPVNPMDLGLRQVGIKKTEVDKALVVLEKIRQEGKSIIVYGDYDADGVCATAIVWETLYDLKFKVLPYLPDRFHEGYGLNESSLKKLKENSPDLGLIITVDQGIVAHAAVKTARKMGLAVIVTDHHQPKKTLPSAEAVVHTTQLCGAGVGWFLARGIGHKFGGSKEKIRERLGLAAIGTVTDLLPLQGPSRSMVVYGLAQLAKTKRPGLRQLITKAGIEKRDLGTYELGFVIGPRLNSAGRLGDATEALRLVCSTDSVRCARLAEKIEKTNFTRQQLMENLAAEAREIWLTEGGKSKLIFVVGQGWPEGVIGLAASKLTEEFYLPAVVVSVNGQFAKGSARSIKGFDITKTIREAEDLLIDAGGHPMAAGFTLQTKNLKKLKKALIDLAEQKINATGLEKTLSVDAEVELNDLDLQLWREIERFAPFGVGNPRPDFVVRGARILDLKLIGKGREHLKFNASDESSRRWEVVGFRLGSRYSELAATKKIDLVFDLQMNEWQGVERLQLRLKDIRCYG